MPNQSDRSFADDEPGRSIALPMIPNRPNRPKRSTTQKDAVKGSQQSIKQDNDGRTSASSSASATSCLSESAGSEEDKVQISNDDGQSTRQTDTVQNESMLGTESMPNPVGSSQTNTSQSEVNLFPGFAGLEAPKDDFNQNSAILGISSLDTSIPEENTEKASAIGSGMSVDAEPSQWSEHSDKAGESKTLPDDSQDNATHMEAASAVQPGYQILSVEHDNGREGKEGLETTMAGLHSDNLEPELPTVMVAQPNTADPQSGRPRIPARPKTKVSYRLETSEIGGGTKKLPGIDIVKTAQLGKTEGFKPLSHAPPKPTVPPRPQKLSGNRANFAKDLESRLRRGPPAPSITDIEKPPKKALLVDARKDRARGPPRRTPTNAKTPERAVEPVLEGLGYSIAQSRL
ncbi:hypothetical protein NEOLI_003863 [Neolecta irregularis DAH-3]|uniref:Uncharacterized protein n=1 Tax=Neolecta irregularis (strain DAH-3) TaxID=1198029 RepID=A0A1U7LU58_NEOID|nr:hypothetical protein NEOLI_003863 [Neolecta irregularis DAH-3]|eukprot:OLL26197.1 hypothetical protein NEOLI_003863 [Neolecta irregularis DAH-3]